MPHLNQLSKDVIDYQATKSSESFSRILKGVNQWLFTETRKLHFILKRDGYSVTKADCKQELLLVLLKAIERYDHRSGANFFTVLYNHHATAVVVARKRKLHPFCATRDAVESGLDLASLRPTEQLSRNLADDVEQKDFAEINEEHAKLVSCMDCCLNERESDILHKRAEGLTLLEIGNDYGVTRERIRQLEKRALQKVEEKYAVFTYEEEKPNAKPDPVLQAAYWVKISKQVNRAVGSVKARKRLIEMLTGDSNTYLASA